jgi:hypothetical protein
MNVKSLLFPHALFVFIVSIHRNKRTATFPANLRSKRKQTACGNLKNTGRRPIRKDLLAMEGSAPQGIGSLPHFLPIHFLEDEQS